jgi:hypothetical protein
VGIAKEEVREVIAVVNYGGITGIVAAINPTQKEECTCIISK